MLQKITLTHYLLFGISALTSLVSCGPEEVEYRLTFDLQYVNATDSTVSFDLIKTATSNTVTIATLDPNSTSEVFSYDIEGVDKKPKKESCCEEILVDLFAGRGLEGISKLLILNDTLCVIHLDEHSVNISNYVAEEIGYRHFKYTYTFTEADFENAEKCGQ